MTSRIPFTCSIDNANNITILISEKYKHIKIIENVRSSNISVFLLYLYLEFRISDKGTENVMVKSLVQLQMLTTQAQI